MDGAKPTTIFKRDALGRVTLPREQREALLDEFELSGMPATRFARAAGGNYLDNGSEKSATNRQYSFFFAGAGVVPSDFRQGKDI
jgi:hypothetical protein